jgi:hypothetical protein
MHAYQYNQMPSIKLENRKNQALQQPNGTVTRPLETRRQSGILSPERDSARCNWRMRRDAPSDAPLQCIILSEEAQW